MTIFLSFLAGAVMGINVQVKNLRTAYFKAAEDAKHLPTLKKAIDTYTTKDHYFYCYTSAYNSLLSRYAKGIGKKMEWFNQCKKDLDQSFKISDSFDARFIRFCIQHNTPRILGYKTQLDIDKKYIMQNLQQIPGSEYKNNVKAFLKSCDFLTEQEKTQVEKL